MKNIFNKKVLIIFALLSIIIVEGVLLGINLNKKHNKELETRMEDEIKINSGEVLGAEIDKSSAVDKYTMCINSNVNEEELPDNVKNIINEIREYYKKDKNYFSYKYVDIQTGFNVSINENQAIFTASTIKGPAAIYIYEMADEGKINLDDVLTYTSKYYDNGGGILRFKNFNTTYSTKELLDYSITLSDNSAHMMLVDKYGRDNMMNFWKSKGTNTIFTKPYTQWGNNTAHDAAIYMNELYRYYQTNGTYSDLAMNEFLNAKKKILSAPNDYKIANKAGWWHEYMHDAAIVFAENPYVVVAFSTLGSQYNGPFFKNISNLTYQLHSEYWKYKMESCSKIEQYK